MMKSLAEIPPGLDRVVPLGEPAPTACPKCHGSMELASIEDQFLLLCQACQGLLVQSQVLAQVIQLRRKTYSGPETRPTPLDPQQLKIRIPCPGCGREMDVHPYHGPGNCVIDSCGRCCFTFLDYGELAEIEKAPGQRD